MTQTFKKIVVLLLAGLFQFSQSGCADVGEAPSSTPVSQPAGTTAGASAGVEVIRQPTAEVILAGPDGFAPGDLEVITPENADRLRELAVIGPGQFKEEVDVSPDGEYLAVAATNGVLFYDPVSGELVDFYPTSNEVIDMAISPDGQRLATVTLIKSDEHFPAKAPNPDSFVTHPVLTIWDRTTDEAVLVQPLQGRGCGEYTVNDLVFSPDGALLAFRDEYFMQNFTETDNLCVISAEDGSLVQTIPLETSWAPTGGLAFANEGQTLVTIFNQDLGEDQYLREMHKYDLESGERVQTFEIERGSDLTDFTNLALSPDGQWLAVPASGGVRIYALADGRLMSAVGRETDLGVDVAFSPDGQTLVFSLRENINSLVSGVGLASVPDGTPLWEIPAANLLYVPTLFEDPADKTELAFSSDGAQIFNLVEASIANQNAFVQILDAREGRETGRIYVPSVYVRQELSPDGSRVLFGGYQDGEIQLWSVPGNELLWSAHEHTAMVVGMAFSPDGQQAATASLDGSVQLWRVADGTLERTLSEALGPTWRVAYAPDGKQLASLSGDGMVRLWNPSTGELVKEIPTGVSGPWQRDMVFTPGGEGVFIASGCQDFQCQEDPNEGLHWVDLETGEVELLLNFPVYHFTLTAGQSLAGMQAQGIQIFDMGTLQIIHGHTSPLGTGALVGAGVSPDGSLFLSGNGFGLHVWDNASGQLVGIIEGLEPWGEITFSADQRLVSISGDNGVFSVWGVPAE